MDAMHWFLSGSIAGSLAARMMAEDWPRNGNA